MFGLCTSEDFLHHVELIEPETFIVSSSYSLQPKEHALSIISCCIGPWYQENEHCICVGSRLQLLEGNREEGGIYIFKVGCDKIIRCQCRNNTEGAVHSLCESKGKLFAGVNEKICIYEWTGVLVGIHELSLHTKVLHLKSFNDYILAGDMAWSNYLYRIKGVNAVKLVKVGSDGRQTWSSAMEFITTKDYVCADGNYRLAIFRKKIRGKRKEKSGFYLCKAICEFYTGDFINQFRKISVPGTSMPAMLFGTANGAVGLLASLSDDLFT